MAAKRWYVIHTYSGYEKKVKTDLEHRIETYGLKDQIVDIKIPTEEVTKVKEGGERETKDMKVFPGYVLVRMEVNDNSWSVVRNTPGVSGFVGLGGVPTPLRRSDFNKIMRRTADETAKAPRHTVTDFEIGQNVKIVNNKLKDFVGQIIEIMPEAGKVRITTTIFGRETPVELGIDEIESID